LIALTSSRAFSRCLVFMVASHRATRNGASNAETLDTPQCAGQWEVGPRIAGEIRSNPSPQDPRPISIDLESSGRSALPVPTSGGRARALVRQRETRHWR
jgi:hypothetical protein